MNRARIALFLHLDLLTRERDVVLTRDGTQFQRRGHCGPVRPVDDVCVDAQRRRNAGVPKLLLRNLRRHPKVHALVVAALQGAASAGSAEVHSHRAARLGAVQAAQMR
jgi:hypothetical protein